ncbi:rho guanine nucleotide exchange factor TIAM1-like isoform X1 [Cyprinus carpio]|uniref:Rho guanine nucleotide exchange factor TIAM1-like isoform X1 n=3 Tax=Cyprinus carpio TaxID=7962 RepID=A0A9R0AEU6_CYPCA|nr:rho guanine nucleotide exchange factor TIAM1-like isoform X1 [Cyprinus carpio]XP_042596110.1 rho guanine nucleotide exchange factor TIAM1-like isoform X1 [Cyprinus carpio]XP_042596111.1 rho guanine nucleotide exchange factor TIAM1-like isoform X1 [Cyprinus carpio]XP_042596112.1 rho guanine nucleotide exchange factor TIAM1-like isoform X1 [Cyprinus carpio]
MGNTESHSGGHGYYGDGQRHLSRKHMSRSLRLSSKQTYCSRRTPSGKPEHRNSETSTRSSSTPSIPQSLADHGLEPFNDSDMLPNFSGPIWVDRVAMNLRPMSFHNHPAHSPAATAKQATQDDIEPPEDTTLVQCTRDSSQEASSFKKKRSKSADMWREDSLEVSLSDLSQEHLTSTEEIGDTPDDCETRLQSPAQELLDSNRANSLDELYGPKSPACRPTHGRYAKWHKGGGTSREGDEDKMISPCEDDGAAYSAYTLPCRRSHCLSEGPTNHQGVMQGRRAQTIQDVTAGDGSDYEDSGIDGLTGDSEASQHHARRYKTMSVSFSAYSTSAGGAFAGSDSGSSSGAGAGPSDGTQGVYENFRQELEQNVSPLEVPEERSSAFSDEQSSVTLSSAYHTDPLLNVAAVQGTVRKAGRLAVKNFLVHKKNKKVEPAPRRKWKSYWVSLKGCTLFFYETDGRSGIDHNSVPKHAVWAENSIVQAVPEHPKKDFVFCLSNSLGDSFLFQTCSQTELENWITAIHSACAAAVARQHHREDTVRLLRAEIRKLEQKIDMDEKMKKMGDMQLSAVTDAKKRKTILEQIFLWEQNLEQFHMDLFRFRCYLSSLQGGELPNPKRLLAFASRPTKLAMGRLGIFSVSSFHALVAARTESGVRRRTQAMSRSTSKRKSRFSSLWGLDTHSKRKSKGHPSINQVFAEGGDPVKSPLEGMFEGSSSETTKDTKTPVKGLPRPSTDHDIWSRDHLTPSWVLLPNDQPVLAIIQPGESALDMLETICKAHQLDPTKHYVRLKFLIENQVQFYIPKPEEDIYDLLYKEIELCCKIRKVIQFDRDESCMIGYGFSISVVEEDSVQQLYITDVRAGGLAFAKGLNAGDEILQLNGKDARTLTFADMKVAFAQVSLSLTVNTLPPVDRRQLCFLPPRRSDAVDNLYTDIFSQSQEEILDDGVGLIVETSGDSLDDDSELFTEFDDYGKSTEQVAAFCRSLHEMNPSSEVVSSSSGPESSSLPPSNATPRQLSDADKLRKVICELVETERTYVKDLNYLIGRYLTPLQKESFLTQDELDVLFGNLPEMLEFQVEFLKTLEDGTRLVPDLEKLERVEEFKKILFSLGGSFLYYADRFKIYSAFCASHTKVPKVLVKAKTDVAFKAFLDERNPKQQHSSTLESYLIKPIQRVLKYPLLLRELHSLTDPDSEEHYHLNVAMKAMNTVASHINEMQKIHEEFGAVFDLLISEQTGDKKEVADLSMGDLLLHTSVTWINPSSSLGKCKKEPQLATFVFKMAVVFICKDYSKQKKKMGGSHRASVSGEEKDPFRFRHMIPTDALQVRTLSNTDGESAAVCEIIHVKSESEGRPERVFQLCCSSPESKKDFLKTVHSILRDKQRRQLLKTESLPLSQQYVPFGGKRLCALKGARPAMNRAVSAPTRTLGRRKLVRNRFTIDTDIVFDTEPDSDSPDSQHAQQQGIVPAGDTDRWVEEQFDLQRYEEQEQDVKETDILSDDDEFCQSALSPSTDPDVEGPLSALSLEGDTAEEEEEEEEGSKKDYKSQHAKLSHLGKQCAMSVASVDEQVPGEDIWVRRDSSTENETQDGTQS